MKTKNQVGCPCCAGCTIAEDTFDRADSDTTGWDEISGTWEILSAKLVNTGAGVALFGTQFPLAVTQQLASASFSAADDGDTVRVIIAADATAASYLAAEVLVSSTCAALKLFKVVSGTPTQLAQLLIREVPADAVHLLRVCYAPDSSGGDAKLIAFLTLEDGSEFSCASTVTATIDDYAGLAVTAVTSAVSFTNFKLSYTSADEPTCKACEPNCLLVFETDFASVPDLGCPWEEVSGVWVGSSTSSANALAIHTAESLPGEGNTAALSIGSTEGVFRVVCDYVDANNYHFLELDKRGLAPYTCQLYKRSGGVDTLLDESFTASGVPAFMRIWICDGYVYGLVDSATPLHSLTTAHGGQRVGYGTGAAHSTSWAPLVFSGGRTSSACACPALPVSTGCGACSGKVITQINLIIPAATTVAGGSTDTIAGTYVLTLDPLDNCAWGGSFGILSPKDGTPTTLIIAIRYEIFSGVLSFHGTIRLDEVGNFVQPPASDFLTDFIWGRYAGSGTGCDDVPRLLWIGQNDSYDLFVGDNDFEHPVDHWLLQYDASDRSLLPRLEIYQEDA